ncbi:MAG: hypothetical protein WC831_06265 [Parcubacteria group bacterium]|jgi:retron-type reverse transcriptase
MKTRKKLFEKLISLENLALAYKNASKTKRFKKSILLFDENLAENILMIQKSLAQKTYRHGRYNFFIVRDTKERQISAAPFFDRVVHHALYQILNPIFDQKFIFDSFANREEKGTHKAVERLQYFLKKIGKSRERERERESKRPGKAFV